MIFEFFKKITGVLKMIYKLKSDKYDNGYNLF